MIKVNIVHPYGIYSGNRNVGIASFLLISCKNLFSKFRLRTYSESKKIHQETTIACVRIQILIEKINLKKILLCAKWIR